MEGVKELALATEGIVSGGEHVTQEETVFLPRRIQRIMIQAFVRFVVGTPTIQSEKVFS
jgi:hypothetical protein